MRFILCTTEAKINQYKKVSLFMNHPIFNTVRKINNLYNNSYHTTLKATPEEILNKKINKNIVYICLLHSGDNLLNGS